MTSETLALNIGNTYKPIRDGGNNKSSFFSYPDILRVRGSVLFNILPQVSFMMLFAALNVYISKKYERGIALPNTIIPSLSVVIGMLLVFRTNNSYDRYYEGRKLWTTIKGSVRNLSRTISSIPVENQQDVYQKVDALKLLIAYIISVKDYLRDESDKNHQLIDDILPPRLKSDKFNALEFDAERNKYLSSYGALSRSISSTTSSSYRSVPDLTNPLASLPLEIATELNAYTYNQKALNRTDGPTNNAINTTINSLVDTLGGLERIRRTPIPVAYVIHMKQVVFLYCATLPFTLSNFGYWSIPFVGLISFVLYGIDGIGQQIEDPFGYDENDLPLDQICFELRKELDFMINKTLEPERFGFDKYNFNS